MLCSLEKLGRVHRIAGNAHMQGAYTLRPNENPTLDRARILPTEPGRTPLAAKLPSA